MTRSLFDTLGVQAASGRTLTIDDKPHAIVGVMPASFHVPLTTGSFYLPLSLDRAQTTNRSGHDLISFGRLREDSTLEAARAELRTILPRWAEAFEGIHPNDPVTHPLILVPLGQQLLGAVRGALVRLSLIESLRLATVGGAGGLGVGVVLTWLFRSLAPAGIPRIAEISLDGPVLAFGILPALQVSRGDPRAALADGGRGGSTGRESARTLRALVVVQMALAVMLLIGSGLLIKSFVLLRAVDPGFETVQRIGFRVQVMQERYPEREQILAFYDRLRERLEAVPGIEEVAIARGLPMRGALAGERFLTLLLGLFAGLALVIASVGIYGVMAFSVARRTREIGIRMALGAGPKDMLRSVLRGSLLLTALGAAMGLIAASMATRVLESLVYEVGVRDLTVFGGSVLALIVAALGASFVPAWRAASIHPADTLRAQ